MKVFPFSPNNKAKKFSWLSRMRQPPKQLISEAWGTNLLLYLYDANGSPLGMQYRTSSMAEDEFYTFWFEKDLFGDIVAMYNKPALILQCHQ